MSLELLIGLSVALPLIISVAVAFVKSKATRTEAQNGDDPLDEFLLGGRNISRNHYVATLTASNAALANILFLYVYWGYMYGMWAWVWGMVFWGVGFGFFSILMKKSRLGELASPNRSELGFNELMGKEFSSVELCKIVAVISGLAFLFLLSLELNVGSKIFSVLTDSPSKLDPYIFALVLGSALAIYTAVGGMRAVIETDVVQFLMVLVGCSALVYLINQVMPEGKSLIELIASSFTVNPAFEFSWRFLPFVFGSIISWGLWFLCTMDMWQRTIAYKIERHVIGVKAILPSYGFLSFITFSGVLSGVYWKSISGSPYPGKYPMVDFIQSIYAIAISNTEVAVLLAFVICGFVAAMLSTVDTYLVIVAHCFAGDMRTRSGQFLSDSVKSNPDDVLSIKWRIQKFIAFIPFLSVFLFYLLENIATQDTFTLYMIAGSMPLAVLPIALVSVFSTDAAYRRQVSSRAAIFAMIAALAGIAVNFSLANYALKNHEPIAFGLLYFVPLFVALIASIPFFLRRAN